MDRFQALALRPLSIIPYDYRDTMSLWWRSLFILQPDVSAVQGANTVYQVHAIVAWAFWALFPFSRLVHAWSIPLQYLGRPYILYRRRYAATSTRPRFTKGYKLASVLDNCGAVWRGLFV